jgi:hypothetical protein
MDIVDRKAMRRAWPLMQWPTILVRGLMRALTPEQLERSMLSATHLTHCSMFSGMGTTEAAMNILTHELSKSNFKLQVTAVSCCDSSSMCQRVLETMTPQSTCIFKNAADMLSARPLKAKTFASRARRVFQDKKRLFKAYCVRHAHRCEVKGSDVLDGGSPCVDHSTMGLQTGLQGNTVPLAAFMMRARFSALAVHENVPRFPLEAWNNFPGKHCVRLITDTHDVGFGRQTARQRIYDLLIDEDKFTGINPQLVYDSIRSEFASLQTSTPAAVFMVAKCSGDSEKSQLGEMQRRHLRGFTRAFKKKHGHKTCARRATARLCNLEFASPPCTMTIAARLVVTSCLLGWFHNNASCSESLISSTCAISLFPRFCRRYTPGTFFHLNDNPAGASDTARARVQINMGSC